MSDGKIFLIPNSISQNINESIPESTKKATIECSLFIVERAKSSRKYLKFLGVNLQEIEIVEMSREFVKQYSKSQNNLGDNNKKKRIQNANFEIYELIKKTLLSGKNIGILSESGCPGIADPGQKIVELAHENGWTVEPLIGPSSIILALMASGLNGQSFKFCGYLPKFSDERRKALKRYEQESYKNFQTEIFIETVYRNFWTFGDIISACQDNTNFTVAISLTSEEEYIKTMKIWQWQKFLMEKDNMNFLKNKLEKQPAIFLILS